ncbi:MAG: hypothetical protein NZ805_00790 [Armatimonadetes bacterium]|nr:hypothetical protein [Armatimonadota bacterium]MDW8028999.1 hypothetical protein [Armatimonadota bacterium]
MKSGELQWRSALIGSKELFSGWAIAKDGNRRGLFIAWEDGTAELFTMQKR